MCLVSMCVVADGGVEVELRSCKQGVSARWEWKVSSMPTRNRIMWCSGLEMQRMRFEMVGGREICLMVGGREMAIIQVQVQVCVFLVVGCGHRQCKEKTAPVASFAWVSLLAPSLQQSLWGELYSPYGCVITKEYQRNFWIVQPHSPTYAVVSASLCTFSRI